MKPSTTLDQDLIAVARRWQDERPEYITKQTMGGGDLLRPFTLAAERAMAQVLREQGVV